jgi:hypothetical protein
MLSRLIRLTAVILVFLFPQAVLAASVDVQSIDISPAEIAVGQRPSISVSIHANSDAGEVIVIASLVRPDNVLRSWNWKNISLKAGGSRTIFVPGGYDTDLAGVYKVDFNVYTKDMRPMSRLSKTFTVTAPGAAMTQVAPPEKREAERPVVNKSEHSERNHYLGIGAFGTAMNPAGGASLYLWSSKYSGLQASYSTGQFTTVEGRLLLRYPLGSGIAPYIGVGYAAVSTERTVDLLYIKSTFRDNGPSGAAGVEVPIGDSVVGFVEVSGASIDLKKNVDSGGVSGTAKVDYSTVSIGAGIVWYLF